MWAAVKAFVVVLPTPPLPDVTTSGFKRSSVKLKERKKARTGRMQSLRRSAKKATINLCAVNCEAGSRGYHVGTSSGCGRRERRNGTDPKCFRHAVTIERRANLLPDLRGPHAVT